MPKGMGTIGAASRGSKCRAARRRSLVFAMGLLFVFLVLVAQYESLTTPFVIMMAVPLALLGAVGGIFVRRLDRDS